MAAAFHAGVLFGWAQPDAARRATGLRGVFAGTLRHCRRVGGIEVVAASAHDTDHDTDHNTGPNTGPDTGPDTGPAAGPAAVAGWVPADRLDLSTLDLLRSGLVVTPLWLGPQATVRLERHERPAEDRLVAQRRPGDAYLWVLGARPRAQGRGHGAAALSAALTAMAAAGHDRCLLRTDDPPNVPWYQRQGFEVVEHLDDLRSGLPAWILARPLS